MTNGTKCNICGIAINASDSRDIPPYGVGAELLWAGERAGVVDEEGVAICVDCEDFDAHLVSHPDER